MQEKERRLRMILDACNVYWDEHRRIFRHRQDSAVSVEPEDLVEVIRSIASGALTLGDADALSFEAEMAKIRALARLSREQVDELALDAKRLARTTTLTPLQALRRSCDELADKWAAEADDLRRRGITPFLSGPKGQA